jgi:hypothetical protein
MADESPLAWIATPIGAQVTDAAGEVIGTVERVLGDENADIFHGLAVRLASDGQVVDVPAQHIERITAGGIHTTLGPGEADSLPQPPDHPG